MEWIVPIFVAGIYAIAIVISMAILAITAKEMLQMLLSETVRLGAGAARVLNSLETRLSSPGELGSAVTRLVDSFTDKHVPAELEPKDKIPAELETWIDGWQDDWAKDGYKKRAQELYAEFGDWHIVKSMITGTGKEDEE